MKTHIARNEPAAAPSAPEPEQTQAFIQVPFLEQWQQAGAKLYTLDDQYCLIRESIYPLDHQHGLYTFHQAKQAIENWNNWSGGHPLSAKGLKPEQLFFFDTETTGLGGGVGNTIFLLGYARVLSDYVIVRQHVLPKPGHEVALYHSFLEKVDYKTLVTYNGKSFDWPQVKTRHTLVREHVPKLPDFGHFDLLHAARRMWKHKIESVKLVNVEKEILEINRKDDVPGFLAPMIYFDFVENQKPDALLKVLEHNETDILSLIILYAHLSFLLQEGNILQSDREKMERAKWFQTIGEEKTAAEAYQKLADSENSHVQQEAKMAISLQLKKSGQLTEAERLWKEVAEAGSIQHKKIACIELAKYYEHKIKNYHLALSYAGKAKELQEAFLREDVRETDRFLQETKRRITRLSQKIENIKKEK